jgi:hypothetical protein
VCDGWWKSSSTSLIGGTYGWAHCYLGLIARYFFRLMSVEFVPQEMLIIRLEDDWPLRRNRLQTPTQGGSSSVAERQLPKVVNSFIFNNLR